MTGLIHRIEGERLSIGRERSNSLQLDDATVSRHHCVLEAAGEGWKIRDLESHNGTYVNLVPVRERVLASRDEIRIGACDFVFLDGEEDEAGREAAKPQSKPVSSTRTVVALNEAKYLDPAKLAATFALGARHGRELSAILRLTAALPGLGCAAAVSRKLLEGALESLPGERGEVLLADPETGEMDEWYGWERETGASAEPPLAGENLRKVATEGAAMLMEVDGGTSWMIAAPLTAGGETLGAVGLETSSPAAQFDRRHLEWLAAAAAIASPAFQCIRRMEWIQAEYRRLLDEINIRHNMVGESAAMQEVIRQIAKTAPADATVLIEGETGTGKELVARAIHAGSGRRGGPFVAVNCATLSESLLESDLFGHEKGAFTGAIAQKRGKIETAEGGTLFLDEVGELAAPMQAKLLRVLQEREFERVGGLKPIRANIRLITATNRDLSEGAKSGTFRSDLYYRLNVIAIQVPPLRERREDIPLLASYFLSRIAGKAQRKIHGFSPAARRCLCTYDWPGNVRELENAIERSAVLGSSELIEVEDLPETLLEREPAEGAGQGQYHDAVRGTKRNLILKALEEAQGNHQEAARRLGLNPTYLSRLIRNLGLRGIGG